MNSRGFTLTEVLVASLAAVIVMLGLVAVDLTRVRITEDLRARVGANPELERAALASVAITRQLELADRVNLDASTGLLQMRTPVCPTVPPNSACLNSGANYRWDQYRLNAATQELELYANTTSGCAGKQVLAGQVASLAFQYLDEAGPPPGGEPFPGGEDNNLVEFALVWSDGARTQRFPGLVTLRAAAYTDLSAGAGGPGDSGFGLAPPGVDDVPPPPC